MIFKATTSTSTLPFPASLEESSRADRIGTVLSTLCAVHCAVTPLLMLTIPTFGKLWAHPASHWLMALFVVPLAAFAMSRGYQHHRRKWIIGIGVIGILLVLAGAAAPHIKQAINSGEDKTSNAIIANAPINSDLDAEPAAAAPIEEDCDACCPSLTESADGSKRLNIPLASILTTCGSLFLIGTHIGNLCRCPRCCSDEVCT